MDDGSNDQLWRFIIENSDVRGQIVRLGSAWQEVLKRHDYPETIRPTLGNSLCAISLLGATIKFQRSIILQVTGQGPARMLVTQATHDHTVRGLATWRGELPSAAASGGPPPLDELFGTGRLVMTIDPGRDGDQYQSVVPLVGGSIGAVLEHYFEMSEQLPSRFWFAVDGDVAVGLMLQRMPREGADTDAWNRCVIKTDTVTDGELLNLAPLTLLRRLFGEERLAVYSPQAVRFHCPCSRERTSTTLQMLGEVEVRDILAERGSVEVVCEFCNEAYEFDAVDVEALFRENVQSTVPERSH
jgi:molecular chaperone Hsp33